MIEAETKALDRRLARLEGQVRGLRRMVGEGAYCVDVLHQVSAVRSALDQFAAALATNHVRHCIAGHSAGEGHPHAKAMSEDELFDELKGTLSKLLK